MKPDRLGSSLCGELDGIHGCIRLRVAVIIQRTMKYPRVGMITMRQRSQKTQKV